MHSETKENKSSWRFAIKEGQMTSEVLTLGLYFVIFANFILGIVIANPILNFRLNQQIINMLLLVYFFVYVMLFELGSLFYFSAIKKIYKSNEIKYLSWAVIIILSIGTYVSIRYLGIKDTLPWTSVTWLTLILFYLGYKMNIKSNII